MEMADDGEFHQPPYNTRAGRPLAAAAPSPAVTLHVGTQGTSLGRTAVSCNGWPHSLFQTPSISPCANPLCTRLCNF